MRLLSQFDRQVTANIRHWPESYRPLMLNLTLIGEPWVVILAAFVGYLSAWHRRQLAIEHAFVYAVIAFGLNTLLKLLLHRRRPHNLIIKTLGVRSYSFPSGHAFGTVIVYGLFAYLDLKYLAHPWNLAIAGLLGALIILIGGSRVYLDTHYPSDVLAGWLLGFISLLAVVSLAF